MSGSPESVFVAAGAPGLGMPPDRLPAQVQQEGRPGRRVPMTETGLLCPQPSRRRHCDLDACNRVNAFEEILENQRMSPKRQALSAFDKRIDTSRDPVVVQMRLV